MSINYGKPFVEGALATTASLAVYTGSAALNRSVINYGRVTNYSAAPENLTIHVVPSGGSAIDQYLAIDAKPIAANDTELLAEIIGQPIELADQVFIKASADTALTVSFGGTEITS